MSKIKAILDSLAEEQKTQLLYAFEQGFTQFVIYEPHHFIGVNAEHIHNLIVEDTEGEWSIGQIKR